MHAELRSLLVEGDSIQAFAPASPDHFGVLVAAEIGPSVGLGSEVFYLTVCSPSWLAENALEGAHKGSVFLRHHLVLDAWGASQVDRAVNDLCRRSAGDRWQETAVKLSRYLAWEFEE